MNKHAHSLMAQDAMRLLANAIYCVNHLELTGEGCGTLCKDVGEVILQDALQYLAYGDISAARELIGEYELWIDTGAAPWPYGSASDR